MDYHEILRSDTPQRTFNTDSDLFLRFVQESQGINSFLDTIQAPDIQLSQLQPPHNRIYHNQHIENEVNSTSSTGDNLREINLNTDNIIPDAAWPTFISRWFQLQNLIHNLILLDHIIIVFLFPFSLFNIFRALFSELTFSECDFYIDIMQYIKFIPVVDSRGKALLFYTDSIGLLIKFHNIVVYYTRNFYHLLDTVICNTACTTRIYSIFVRMCTISIYLGYGFLTTSYLCFATFFFALCFGITVVKRYKGVECLVNQVYQNAEGVF